MSAKGLLHEDGGGEAIHSKTSRELSFSVENGAVSGSFDGMDIVAGRDLSSSSSRADKARAKAIFDDLGGYYAVVLSANSAEDYGFSGYIGLSYENKSQVGKIALAISAFRSEVPDLCRSPIRSEGRQASLHSIIRLAGVPPR